MSNIYGGLEWAFTPLAKTRLAELTQSGIEYDLAVTLLHKAIDEGIYTEQEIYHIPADSDELKVK